ncbi:hypothetical protein [Agromyces sp. LHK192]|uniref:hypothetical protein n=1 Tax=Agromyces sp. LHK192 TaxID=2498704 RepID=UPI000FDC64DD|nr:hypothetical protein [Agromyces sp. LHK192]
MDPGRDAAIRALLLEEIRQEPTRHSVRRRRNWWIAGGIAFAVAGVGATAGGIVLEAQRASNAKYVFCLKSDTRAADGSYPGAVGGTIASDDGRGRVENAVELCSQMWVDGLFEPDYDPVATSNPPGRVPAQLEVCVMPDGAAAVVPSDTPTICNRLGMAPLEA